MPADHKTRLRPPCYSIMQRCRIRSCLPLKISTPTHSAFSHFILTLAFAGVCILGRLESFIALSKFIEFSLPRKHWCIMTNTHCLLLSGTSRNMSYDMSLALYKDAPNVPLSTSTLILSLSSILLHFFHSTLILWMLGLLLSYAPSNTFGSMYKTDHHIWRSHSILFPSCKFHNCLFCFVSLFIPTLSWNDFSVTNE